MFLNIGLPTSNPFSQPPEVEIEKFQCPSERELPEEFETHPTFIPSGILEGVKAILNMGAFFLGHTVL